MKTRSAKQLRYIMWLQNLALSPFDERNLNCSRVHAPEPHLELHLHNPVC